MARSNRSFWTKALLQGGDVDIDSTAEVIIDDFKVSASTSIGPLFEQLPSSAQGSANGLAPSLPTSQE
jgi:hypothetical protein